MSILRVKIIGAGSIGNHLGNAARQLGWKVDICDADPSALDRTQNQIYPGRYGNWDPEIGLYRSNEAPVGIYDLIAIGTPPDSHIDLAFNALDEKPKALLIEKPLCKPDLKGAQELWKRAADSNTRIFVGYDHVVGEISQRVTTLLETKTAGSLMTLDIEFREHWGGIFAAHPWLNGPADSYLGYWKRGGGALAEHSHAVNLWQHMARAANGGQVCQVSAMADYVVEGPVNYDQLCALHLTTNKGLSGRVIQDVITAPAKKWGRAQGSNGYIEWNFGLKPGHDSLQWVTDEGDEESFDLEKNRPDDFIAELQHINNALSGAVQKSPIELQLGLDTMLVIAAAHLSAQEKKTIVIDYNRGYSSDALSPI